MLGLRSNNKIYNIWQNVEFVAMFREYYHAINLGKDNWSFIKLLEVW
jgi:hypothetical protein